MPRERVRELARELAEELDRAGTELDEEQRRALDGLRDRVERALEQEATEPPSAEARTLVERLERDHPALTALIQRLADALMNAGL